MDFKAQLQQYQHLIEADIQQYVTGIKLSTIQQFGKPVASVNQAFLNILSGGGKRLRGALVIVGYQMGGGQINPMIVRAATALEMIHAYLLIIDDIQDRALLRRGQPAAHVTLAQQFGDDEHLGSSLAINAALAGLHAAETILANLDVNSEARLKVMSIVNQTLVTTTAGQTQDMLNQAVAPVREEDIENVLDWKTANYTFLNPLCVGLVLAGAGCDATDAVRDYALAAGRAFQLADDIQGVFGEKMTTGKDVGGDIREGKQTWLTIFALSHANQNDANFLQQALGNPELTESEFQRCQQIMRDCGALDFARHQIDFFAQQAIDAIEAEKVRFPRHATNFLKNLVANIARI